MVFANRLKIVLGKYILNNQTVLVSGRSTLENAMAAIVKLE